MRFRSTALLTVFACCLALDAPAFAADKRTPATDLVKMTGKEAEAYYLGLNAIMWGHPSVKIDGKIDAVHVQMKLLLNHQLEDL